MYGVGGGSSPGEFRINLDQNRIEISANTDFTSLVMEYVADEARYTDPEVHIYAEEALRCYIYYKYVQRKRGIPANEKQMAKRAYYNEKRLARARMMSFNKETAMAVSRKAFKQSPKM